MSIKSIKTGWTGISVLAGNPQPGSFESIQTVTVASTAATVEFTSIPSGYTHLQIRGIAKSTGAGSQDLQVGFNSNTSSYAFHSLYGTGGGGTASSTNFTNYFFTITGFHGFHVFTGVVINIIMLIMTLLDKFEQRGHYLMIEKAGLYWHFVDLVWVFVFTCFYLV